MMLMCIDKGSYHLTKGKIYSGEICKDAPSDFNPGKQVFGYYIINDKGVRHGVEKELFIDIVKIRQDKLKELGI
jgi:hypothetical protein